MTRLPPLQDGRRNRGWCVRYRARVGMAWRTCTVWAPTKAEAIGKVKSSKGRLALYIECDQAETT